MKKRYILSIVLILIFNTSSAQELKKEYQDVVQTFIDCIKSKNVEKLTTIIRFPLRREYPLPEIKNGAELHKRYEEIFDDTLTNIIIKSDIKNDWSTVGWRGIMLNNGTLWLDYEGNLIGINYQSYREKIRKENLIEKDRASMHMSLKHFENPVLILETKKFRVRIDELSNGVYRYASWPINLHMNEKPDLILENGKWIPDGNGGNHSYKFVNGNYTYECSINVLKEAEVPSAYLIVYKNNDEILRQSAQIMKK